MALLWVGIALLGWPWWLAVCVPAIRNCSQVRLRALFPPLVSIIDDDEDFVFHPAAPHLTILGIPVVSLKVYSVAAVAFVTVLCAYTWRYSPYQPPAVAWLGIALLAMYALARTGITVRAAFKFSVVCALLDTAQFNAVLDAADDAVDVGGLSPALLLHVHVHRAMSFRQLGDVAEAEVILRKALHRAPDAGSSLPPHTLVHSAVQRALRRFISLQVARASALWSSADCVRWAAAYLRL